MSASFHWLDRSVRWARLLALVSASASVFAWIGDVVTRPEGDALPAPLDRLLIASSLLALLGWGALATFRALRTSGQRRRRALVVLGLLVAALAIEMSTIDFQLVSHARNDEGVYISIAEKILSGEEPLPEAFNYGHFLYYAGAFSLWIYEHYPEPVARITGTLYGHDHPREIHQLLLRGITGLLGALTVVPVFLFAQSVAGTLAGLLGGLLIAFSPIYLEVAGFSISDGPSGFFAALCMLFVGRLASRERTPDYLWAGIAAGLAAGSKYPAGVVAVGIFGVWVYWRLRKRTWSWQLLASAAASILTMLAVMPGLLLRRDAVATGQGLDIGFGFRQYAYGGWIGVVPESTIAWYANELLGNFGWAALVLGLTGLLLVRGETLQRLLAVLLFPATYLALICSMNMVVQRNLQPVLPSLAGLLGVGIAAWALRLRRGGERDRPWAATLVVLVAVAPAAFEIGTWTVRRNRPSTFEVAVEWIVANLPEGASFLREDYTPELPPKRHPSQHRRFAPRFSREEMSAPEWDYLLLSPNAYLRFLDPKQWREGHQEAFYERYQEMFELPLIAEFPPNRLRAGPMVRLFQLDPEEVHFDSGGRFAADDAVWLSDPVIGERGGPGALLHTRRWQFSLYKAYLEAGTYDVGMETSPDRPEGYFYVVSREGEEVGTFSTQESITFDLPRRGKYLFKVFLEPGARFHAFELRRRGLPDDA